MKEANEFEQLKIALVDQFEVINNLERNLSQARQLYMEMENKFCEKNSYQYYNEVLPKIRAARQKVVDILTPDDLF